jgi:hypothetical protein
VCDELIQDGGKGAQFVEVGRGEAAQPCFSVGGEHNDLRAAVEEAGLFEVGSARWWRAVNAARALATDHFASEEPGLLAETWSCLQPEAATVLARQWIQFALAREGGPG